MFPRCKLIYFLKTGKQENFKISPNIEKENINIGKHFLMELTTKNFESYEIKEKILFSTFTVYKILLCT